MPVRLHLGGSQTLWALVRCQLCAEINKYLALEAALVPIKCKTCGQSLDVRELVLADAVARPEISGDLLLKLRNAGRMTAAKGVAGAALQRRRDGAPTTKENE